MAVVSFVVEELEQLVGRGLSRNILENKVPMMGCEFEGIGDGEVEYEVFPNRPDMLSVEGFARALSYFIGTNKGLQSYELGKSGIELNVEKTVEQVRPCISGGVVKNVDLDEAMLRSIMQVQEKIHKTFGRGREKIAIGIHDLEGVESPFTYKGVDPEEVEFTPLQSNKKMNLREIGKKHPKGKYVEIIKKNEKWPVIVDKNRDVLSFPPVINGKLTELTEETKDVFIDVTGTDQKAVDEALNIITTSLAERGGRIETVKIDGKEKPDLSPGKMSVDIKYVNRLLGLDLDKDEFKELAGAMGFGYSDGTVLIPPYRTDMMHPIDVVEDIAISYGYESFDSEIPDVPGTGYSQGIEDFTGNIKEIMLGFGFQEVKTTVLTNKDKQFSKMKKNDEDVAEMENSFSEEYDICRKYIIPGLMDVLSQNQHRSYPQKIFEMGDVVFLDKKSETGTRNRRKAAAVLCDEKVNYVDLASVTESLLEITGVDVEIEKHEEDMFMGERSGTIVANGKDVGVVGEIHPEVLENWNIEKPVVAFEMDLETLRKGLKY